MTGRLRKVHLFLLLALAVGLTACSARVEYQQTADPSSPDAVNINSATADQLERLPHIGRSTADAILAFREKNGPFRRVEQILLIRGISEERFTEIRPMLRVE